MDDFDFKLDIDSYGINSLSKGKELTNKKYTESRDLEKENIEKLKVYIQKTILNFSKVNTFKDGSVEAQNKFISNLSTRLKQEYSNEIRALNGSNITRHIESKGDSFYRNSEISGVSITGYNRKFSNTSGGSQESSKETKIDKNDYNKVGGSLGGNIVLKDKHLTAEKKLREFQIIFLNDTLKILSSLLSKLVIINLIKLYFIKHIRNNNTDTPYSKNTEKLFKEMKEGSLKVGLWIEDNFLQELETIVKEFRIDKILGLDPNYIRNAIDNYRGFEKFDFKMLLEDITYSELKSFYSFVYNIVLKQIAEENKRRAEENKRRAEENKRIEDENKRIEEENKRIAEKNKRREEENNRITEENKRKKSEEIAKNHKNREERINFIIEQFDNFLLNKNKSFFDIFTENKKNIQKLSELILNELLNDSYIKTNEETIMFILEMERYTEYSKVKKTLKLIIEIIQNDIKKNTVPGPNLSDKIDLRLGIYNNNPVYYSFFVRNIGNTLRRLSGLN